MKAWFFSLTQRERTMVEIAAALTMVFLLYVLVFEPITNNYERNKNNLATAVETLEWMRSASQEVAKLRGGNSSAVKPQDKKFILGVVDRSVRKAGLANVMKRVQPEGDLGVRVWFENAAFDDLMVWIATMESEHNLRVNEINIEETESTGLVNVRLFLNSL